MLKYSTGGTNGSLFTGTITFMYALFYLFIATR